MLVYLKLTDKCNLACKHCYVGKTAQIAMSQNTLSKAIDFLATQKNIQVQLHGGEPFLYDENDLFRCVSKIKSLGHEVSATTNLMYRLTQKRLETMQLFHLQDKQFIQTSWDYKIRFKNEKQESLWRNNVLTLITQGFTVQITVCLTNLLIENLRAKDLFEYFDTTFSLNNICLNFERITLTGNAKLNQLRPSNAQLNKWLLDAYIISMPFRESISLFSNIDNSMHGVFVGCRARQCTKNVITINPDGSVASCPNTANMPYATIDDLLKQNVQEKRTIWIKQEQTKRNECYMCEYYKFCNGDCFQLSWDETGCPGPKAIYEYAQNN